MAELSVGSSSTGSVSRSTEASRNASIQHIQKEADRDKESSAAEIERANLRPKTKVAPPVISPANQTSASSVTTTNAVSAAAGVDHAGAARAYSVTGSPPASQFRTLFHA